MSRSSSIVPSTLKSGRALEGSGPVSSASTTKVPREPPDLCAKLFLNDPIARIPATGWPSLTSLIWSRQSLIFRLERSGIGNPGDVKSGADCWPTLHRQLVAARTGTGAHLEGIT